MEGTGGAVRPTGPGVGAGIQFHPCVVLTLDDEGARIAAPLADLLVALPPAVRAGIAILDVREGRGNHTEDTEAKRGDPQLGVSSRGWPTSGATPSPLSVSSVPSVVSSSPLRPSPSSAKPPVGDPTSAVHSSVSPDLDARLTAALAQVTSAHQRDAVRQAGYRVSDARPLVLLSGHTTAPTLLESALAAQRATSRRFGHAFRLALLSDTRPTDPAAAAAMDTAVREQPWDTILGWAGTAEREPPIALVMLYQDADEQSWYWNVPGDAASPQRLDRLGAGQAPADGARPGLTWVSTERQTSSPSPQWGTPTPPGVQPDAPTPRGEGSRTSPPAPLPRGEGSRNVARESGPLDRPDTVSDAAPDHPGSDLEPEAEDVRYAVAEAAFALMTSGLVDDPAFQELLRLTLPTVPGGGGEPAERFGTLATSRLAFPRAQAEAACGGYEAADLLEAWLREAALAERAALSRTGRVTTATRFIRAWLDLTAESDAPGDLRAGLPAPPLSAIGVSRAFGLARPTSDPSRLFAIFHPRAIAREMAGSETRLPVALMTLDGHARARFERWRAAAEIAWAEEAARRASGLGDQLDALLLDDASGFVRARAYLRELRHALTLLAERQEDDERHRAAAFSRYVRGLKHEIALLGGSLAAPGLVSTSAYGPIRVTPVRQATAAPRAAVRRAPSGGDMRAWLRDLSDRLRKVSEQVRQFPALAARGGQVAEPLGRPGTVGRLPVIAREPLPRAYGVAPALAASATPAVAAASVPLALADHTATGQEVVVANPSLVHRRVLAALAAPAVVDNVPGWTNPLPAPPVPSDIVARPPDPFAPALAAGGVPWPGLAASQPFSTLDRPSAPFAPASGPLSVPAADVGDAVSAPSDNPAAALQSEVGDMLRAETTPPETTVDGKTPADSTPAAAARPAAADTSAGELVGASNAPAAPAEDPRSTRMPERLRDLVTLLGVMLAEDDGLLPSRATVLAAIAMLAPFLAYAAVALAQLVPLHWPVLHIGAGQVPLVTVATGAVLALAVSLPTYIYYRHQQRYITRLRRLLVRAYTRWWAECCARAEDTFRHAGLETLGAALGERLAAVDDFEARARAAAYHLRTEADQLDEGLHLSPAGRRDVFAVCGQIYPARRLSHLYRAVRERRQSEPLHPTHTGDDALGDAFRARLLGAGGRLLDLTSDDLAAQARRFGAEVTRPYLTGDLVAVAPAFRAAADRRGARDTERVPLTTLLERATPLYRPQPTDTPARLVALAAPEDVRLPDRMDGPSGDGLTRAFTPSPEWMLTMQLVNRGRPRWWPRSLIGDSGRGALPMGLASAPTVPAARRRVAARRAEHAERAERAERT